METPPREIVTRSPLEVRGWPSLNQEREGGGLPEGEQSRERGSPCRATMEEGRDTAGGTAWREGGRGEREGGREGLGYGEVTL